MAALPRPGARRSAETCFGRGPVRFRCRASWRRTASSQAPKPGADGAKRDKAGLTKPSQPALSPRSNAARA
ncbi:hypothetical protein, partial [Burkholderia glumae]|uniref:hypothetical protein n=1 Tax=Burkholderia glumae TaxID=337 RepID=UPI001E450F64